MSFFYTPAKQAIFQGQLDLRACTVKVMLVMTNTTADTDRHVRTLGDIATLDEFDGSGYTVGGAALVAQAVVEDDPNNRSEFGANALTFATLGAGTRQIQGVVLYGCSGGALSTGTSLPIAFIDSGPFPATPNGADFVLTWHGDGLLQVV